MPRITPMQRKFIKGVAKGLSKSQAAMKAGYAPASAYAVAEKPHVRDALITALKNAGLSTTYLVQKTKEGIENPTKIERMNGQDVTTPDYAVRHRYLETGLRLAGYGDSTRIGVETDGQKSRVLIDIPSNKPQD